MSRDDLVVLMSVATEFHAESIVAALADMDVEAVAFGAAAGGLGMPLSPKGHSVPVQVRRGDLERARDALERIRAGALQINWDEVEFDDPDVGTTRDRVPVERARPPRAMPLPARIAFVVAAIVALCAILSMVLFVLLGSSAGS